MESIPSSFPSRPLTEPDRLRSVTRRHRLGVPRDALERVARLAAHIFETESGLVTFISTDRQLNVACAGHVPEDVSLEVSFCARAIRSGTLLVVEDASTDDRFSQNPLVVEDGGLRFYAGAPIQSATGELIGTVSAFGASACTTTPQQLDRLQDLAALAADVLDRYLRERQYETALEDPKTHWGVLDPDGVLVDVGAAALQRVDASREEVVGHEAWHTPWIPDTDAARRLARRQLRIAAERRTPVPFQTKYRSANGPRLVRGTIRPVIGTGGTVASLVVVGRDVTDPAGEAAAAQEKLKKARQSLDQKTTLLGAMGHEVRNPLTSILAAARVLRSTVEVHDASKGNDATSGADPGANAEPEDLTQYVELIEQGGRRLLSAVNGVIELARIETGAADRTGTSVNLSDHVSEVAETFSASVRQNQIRLTTEAPTPVWAQAYDEGIHLILLNLVSNAVKYTETGGRVQVRAYEAAPDDPGRDASRTEAVLEVEDTGIGMTPDEADQMFEAFYRSGRTPERGADGTGLGLSLVQQVVRRMNGSITVSTDKRSGMTITVRFPSASPDS